jgi:hypothetical protein
VRDRIRAIQEEMLNGDISPHRAANVAIQLAGLMGNCSREIAAARHDYAVVRRSLFASSLKAAHAKIEGEATEEFSRLTEAELLRGDVQELINALKSAGRVSIEEMKLTR